MYARVTELQGLAGAEVDRDLRHFEEEILPRAESIPGMCGGLVLVDRAAGKAMAITLYADQETFHDSREQAHTLRDLAFQRMNLTRAATVHEYEVGVARLLEPVVPAAR